MAAELPSTATQINRDLAKMLAKEDSLDVAGINGHHYLALALPQGKRLTFKCADSEGRRTRTGDFFGAFNNGARLVVEGGVGRFAGDSMVAGELIINGSAGKGLGHNLQGGTVVVHGDAGDNVGLPMADGTIIIDGKVGTHACARMTGGKVIITGEAGTGLGQGMSGGTLYVGGSLPELDPGLKLGRPSPAMRSKLVKLLTRYGLETEGLSLHQITPSKPSANEEEELLEAELEEGPIMEAEVEAAGPVVEAETPEEEEQDPVEAQLESPPNDPLAAAVTATVAETNTAKPKTPAKKKGPTQGQGAPGDDPAAKAPKSKLQALKAEVQEGSS